MLNKVIDSNIKAFWYLSLKTTWLYFTNHNFIYYLPTTIFSVHNILYLKINRAHNTDDIYYSHSCLLFIVVCVKERNHPDLLLFSNVHITGIIFININVFSSLFFAISYNIIKLCKRLKLSQSPVSHALQWFQIYSITSIKMKFDAIKSGFWVVMSFRLDKRYIISVLQY